MPPDAPPVTEGVLSVRYAGKVAAHEIEANAAQAALAARLDVLLAELGSSPQRPRRAKLFGWRSRSAAADVRGLYIYGSVGRGKTMLMDWFFEAAPVERKRRTHFNEFMGDVQDRIHLARREAGSDPIALVVAAIAAETQLLCLDEFAVADIADAMILSRLFEQLFQSGLTLVTTSNTAPEDLYKGGLNRDLFLPFIDVLKRNADIFFLDIATDYRMTKLGGTPVYVTPLGPAARAALDAVWRRLTGTKKGAPATLTNHGRTIHVPEAAEGVARFPFDALCRAPLAASDYLTIARAYHTIVLDDVPMLRDGERDAARRLILLVDTFYDRGVRLIVSAAAEPADLYTATWGEESVSFPRTVSRLIEMRSDDYLAAPPRR
jgi:cell division protein ZapE